jgi:putative restriction endonuclease
MLENYLHKFASVRTDRGRNRYPTATNHRAPHKPFLLLSVMDLIAQGQSIEIKGPSPPLTLEICR